MQMLRDLFICHSNYCSLSDEVSPLPFKKAVHFLRTIRKHENTTQVKSNFKSEAIIFAYFIRLYP